MKTKFHEQKNNKVSIKPAPARDFRQLESGKPSLRVLFQFFSPCRFVDCGFRVRVTWVSSRVMVSVSFIFLLHVLLSDVC